MAKNIKLGSGVLYATPWLATYDTTFPNLSTVEIDDNLLGYISKGCTVSYEPKVYNVSDDTGAVAQNFLTEEKVTLKSGVITWNADTLETLISTANVTSVTEGQVTFDLLEVGGIANFVDQAYLVIFKHVDGNQHVAMKANSQSIIDLAFLKDQETSINAEFSALPMTNGRLLRYYDKQ